MVKTAVAFLIAWLFIFSPAFCQCLKMALVCGDSKVLLIDYQRSRDTIPAIVWQWDAHDAEDLPEEYRLQKFNSVDDCKAINKGMQILVSSSSGAIVVLDRKDRKVLFYASVPNAHSIEVLPGDLIIAAASTHANGNKVMLFDRNRPDRPLFTDSLYSAHGVVWVEDRKSVFALGYDVLREYKVFDQNQLTLKNEWRIPGIGGHDLQLSPDGLRLFVTEHHGSWVFDLKDHSFQKRKGLPDAENIKSVGQDICGQYIYTVPEKSWWTYHVRFSDPERSLSFPDMRVYKARWLE